MKTIIIFHLLTFLLLFNVYGQQKTFIRDYHYRASDTDSKVSSRQKALNEVKTLLIEELGIYVESYVNYQITEEDNKITKEFFTNEIKTISAGTTETIILEENWDGYEYYIKAQIKADPDEVIRRINQTLSARRSSAVIDSLKHLLTASSQEIKLHSQELERLQSQVNQQNQILWGKERSLFELNNQLIDARKQLAKHQAQEKQILSELERIEQKIRSATRTAVNNIRLGMTTTEVKRVCGEPRSIDTCRGINYNYGAVWVMFEGGVVKAVIDARDFERCGHVSYHERRNARFILR